MTASEAMVIGYETSLKAHNALRWMISLQGRRSGGNILLAWDDFGKPVYVPYEMDTPTTYGYVELPVGGKTVFHIRRIYGIPRTESKRV